MENICNYRKSVTSIIMSGNAAGTLLPHTLSTRQKICGERGQKMGLKELVIIDPKVDGLTLSALKIGLNLLSCQALEVWMVQKSSLAIIFSRI